MAQLMMVTASEITKFYGMRPVLRGLSLTIEKGEFVAALGANGAGKTTLLRVLATLIRPDQGTLFIGGIDALNHPARARALIGVVSHQPLLYPDLTAAENLGFYARMYGVAGGAQSEPVEPAEKTAAAQQAVPVSQPLIMEALRRVDLLPRARDPIRTFSRGMVQRLAIARAVLHDPPLLLLDEPYTGLDHVSARNLSALLRELAVVGRAVLMTTHEFGRGLDGITRAILLKSGRLTDDIREGLTADHLSKLFG